MLVALVAVVVWLVRLESLAGIANKSSDKADAKGAAALAKIDNINEELPVLRSKLNVLSDMMRPDKLAEHYTTSATFQAETKKDIERLMDAARKAGAI